MLIRLLLPFLAAAQLSSAYQSIFSKKQLVARSLKRFTKSQPENANCWNRSIEMDGFISPIDAHNHFRPFGGPPVPFNTYLDWMREHGILFSTMLGIGQQIINDDSSAEPCCYYGHCPTKEYRIVPDPLNDIRNAEDYERYKKNSTQQDNIHLTLSATYPNLQSPSQIISIMDDQLDKRFPKAFQWAGEINVFKHALAPNGFFDEVNSPRLTVSTVKSGVLDDFFHRMRDKRSPVTLHCDLGCDIEIKPSTSEWDIQAAAYRTVQETCKPPKDQIKNITKEENVKFWKDILTRGDVSHYNAFFDKNTNQPKPNFRKIQHLQVWDTILSRYSETTIVWAHIGLSIELRTLHPQVHSDIMANLFEKYLNLHADVSWDILAKLLLMNYNTKDKAENYNHNHDDLDAETAAFIYNQSNVEELRDNLHQITWLNHKDHILRTGSEDSSCENGICGPTHAMAMYLHIFERFSDRFVTGTDYVASYGTKEKYPGQKECDDACPTGCQKTKTNHATQVTDTSSINIFLSDKAFKKIVLGENFFRITGLASEYAPPPICGAEEEKSALVGIIVGILVGLIILVLIAVGIWYYLKKKPSTSAAAAAQTVTAKGSDTKSAATKV